MCNHWCLEFASLAPSFFQNPARILEVGSCNVNGSMRDVLSECADEYIGVDLFDGPGVDVVLDVAVLTGTFECQSFDLVASAEMIEHCLKWQDALYQMVSVLREDGLLLITTRSPGFELHDYPADHWRFSYSDFAEIFQPIGDIVAIENDMTLGWKCGIGILVKRTLPQSKLPEWKSWLDTFSVYSMTDEMNHSKVNEDLYSRGIVFDIYSRYKACSDLLLQTNFVAGNSVLDVGSGPECLLGQFLPEATLSYVDPLISKGSGQGRITGNIFSNELNNQVFDCVSAVDVLEHVPHEHRQAFLERASSLTKKTLILGFPTVDSSDAHETDQAINKQYKDVFGQNYPWLEEHFQFGIPALSDVVLQLEELGWHCQTIGHGHAPWLRELLGFVICVLENQNLKKIVLDISERFNKTLYPSDFRSPHYRQFVVASRNPLPLICPPEEIVDSLEGEHMFQALMQDARKQYLVESTRLIEHQDSAVAELTAKTIRCEERALELKSELLEEQGRFTEIINSKSWQLTQPLREMRRLISAPSLQRKRYKNYLLGLADRIHQSLPVEFKEKFFYTFLLNKYRQKLKIQSKLPFKNVTWTPSIDSAARSSLQDLMIKQNIPGDVGIVLSAIKDTFGEDRYKSIIEDFYIVAHLPESLSDPTDYPLVQASELPEISSSPRRRRILFITSLFPSPHHGGGNRILNFIKILSENNDIYLSTFYSPEEDEKLLKKVAPYCCSIQKVPHLEFGGNQAEIHKWLNGMRMDIVHYEWPLSLLNYDPTFGEFHIFTYMEAVSLRLIMDLQCIEPLSKVWLDKFTELIFNLRIELADASLLDARIAVTIKDGDFFKNLFSNQEYAVLNHGLTFDEFVIPDVEPEPNTLVFVGNYKHPPNEEAMTYFFKEIWEGIRKEVPEVRIYLVGMNPSKQIKSLVDDRHIFVTGSVPDVRTYIQKATICIAPLISGAGLRGKVIEYAALRRTFVGTSIAATDLVFRDGIDYLCADTAADFTQKIVQLLKNKEMARQMGISAFETARKNYDTRRLTGFLNRLYNRLEMG